MKEIDNYKQGKEQKRQQAYDRAYRKTSLFLAGLAAPLLGRKLKIDKKQK